MGRWAVDFQSAYKNGRILFTTILKNENNLLKEEINKITTDEKKLFTNLKQENKQLIERINKDLRDHVEKIKNRKIEHNPKLNELEKQIEDTKINIIGLQEKNIELIEAIKEIKNNRINIEINKKDEDKTRVIENKNK